MTPTGSKTAMTDATGSSSYTYDPFGELTSATNGAERPSATATTPTAISPAITYPLPAAATWATTDTVTYGYDAADVLTRSPTSTATDHIIGINADGLPSSGDARIYRRHH